MTSREAKKMEFKKNEQEEWNKQVTVQHPYSDTSLACSLDTAHLAAVCLPCARVLLSAADVRRC